MLMTWLPVFGALLSVLGLLAFLAYCSGQFDAEAQKVANHRK